MLEHYSEFTRVRYPTRVRALFSKIRPPRRLLALLDGRVVGCGGDGSGERGRVGVSFRWVRSMRGRSDPSARRGTAPHPLLTGAIPISVAGFVPFPGNGTFEPRDTTAETAPCPANQQL